MPTYRFTGRSKDGKVQNGLIKVASEGAAKAWMYQERLVLIEIKEEKKSLLRMEMYLPFTKPRVKDKELLVFTKQFSSMLEAGLPLLTVLQSLREEERNRFFVSILDQVIIEVEGGSTLHDALSKFPSVFNEVYVGTAEAGEESGVLGRVLARLCVFMEKSLKTKRKIKAAIVYPSILAVVSMGVIFLFVFWVVPTFALIFKDIQTILPPTTKFMINLSNLLRNDWPWCIVGLAVTIIGIRYLFKIEKVRRFLHLLLLKIPAVGVVIHKTALSMFSNTFGTLLSCGMPVMRCFETAERSVNNMILKEEISEIANSVAKGEGISMAMKKSPYFPGMIVQMVSVGEASGTLDSMLEKVSEYYDHEVDTSIETMLSLLEPVLLLSMGGVVAFILISMYVPLFKMGELATKM